MINVLETYLKESHTHLGIDAVMREHGLTYFRAIHETNLALNEMNAGVDFSKFRTSNPGANMTIQLPDYLRRPEDASSLAEQTLGNLGAGSPPYLSIAGGRFTLIDNTGAEDPITTIDPKTGIPYVDCCIIDAGPHESKIYFGKPYDPNAMSWEPPKCWSDNGVAPSIQCGEPQARSCAPDPTGQLGCKWAVWGSATSKVSGKGVPACGKYQKLALALPDDDVVFLLRVPPNSLENLRGYLAKFRGSGVDVTQVITRISFEKDVLGTLTFHAPGQWISKELEEFRRKVMAAKGTDMLVGRLDKPIQAVLAAPQSQAPAAQLAVSQSPPSSAAAASTLGASPSEPIKRRRGRPPASESAPAGTPAPFAPQAAPNGGFGIQEPAAPDATLEADLKAVFG